MFAEAKSGGAVILIDDETIERLIRKRLHGSQLNSTISLTADADRSTAREELYRFRQWLNGNPYDGNEEEIRVKLYLINNESRFGITDIETKFWLERYLEAYEHQHG